MGHHKLKGMKKAPKLKGRNSVKKKGKGVHGNVTVGKEVMAGKKPDGKPAVKKIDKKAVRREEAAKRMHQKLFDKHSKILLVGEGNFSFARALCRHIGTGESVYATAYDGEAVLNKKYPDAAECRADIEKKHGGTTLVGVDGTRLNDVKEFRKAFTRILFNFPHLGSGEKDVDKSIKDHQKFLSGFFESAFKCLDPTRDSFIHVALKAGEPYKSWRIVQLAKAVAPELVCHSAVDFAPDTWDGYEHRRTMGFSERFSKRDSEELAKGSKVYIFLRKRDPPPAPA